MSNILVVGGAGYIGSHMVKHLLAGGHSVVVADNFSTGFRDAIVGGTAVELDIADGAALDALFAAHRIDAVLHFASFIAVGGIGDCAGQVLPEQRGRHAEPVAGDGAGRGDAIHLFIHCGSVWQPTLYAA